MNRQALTAALLASSAMLALSGAARAEGQLSFLVVDYDAPGMGQWWQLLVETYQSSSGVAVEPRSVAARQYYERLVLETASGTGADVLTVNPNNIRELLAGGHLMPLDAMIDAAGLRDQIVPGGFDSLTVDGVTYAVPITGRTLELLYNRCQFEEAGIAAPPTTPREFLDIAQRLTVVGDDGRVVRYGANMVNGNEDPTYEMLLMWSLAFGGSFSDGQGNFTFDSPPVIEALEFMKEVYDSGAVAKGMMESDLRALFATGGAAMTIDGSWQFPFIEANNAENFACFAAAPVPWDGPSTGGVNMALAVNAKAADPEAAFAFIAMSATPEMQGRFSDFSAFIPYGVNALTEEQRASKPYLEPFLASIGTAHPIFIPGHQDDFNALWPIVVDAVTRTLVDGVPAAESLTQAQSEAVACCAN
jgi:ABC-type glycerol-3-phosphate transport system substrate-binding protein